MNSDAVYRYARQIALPDIGPDGQERICGGRVVVAGADGAAEIAALYLAAAGVGAVTRLLDLPRDGAAWLAALADADVVVRSGFDDDAMLGAAARIGAAVVVVRATPALVDLLSFPRRPPAPDAALEIPSRAADASPDGPAGVLAGTLAASETLAILAGADRPRGAQGPVRPIRHLQLPLDGGAPRAQELGAR